MYQHMCLQTRLLLSIYEWVENISGLQWWVQPSDKAQDILPNMWKLIFMHCVKDAFKFSTKTYNESIPTLIHQEGLTWRNSELGQVDYPTAQTLSAKNKPYTSKLKSTRPNAESWAWCAKHFDWLVFLLPFQGTMQHAKERNGVEWVTLLTWQTWFIDWYLGASIL